ncbi:hypothetical protein DYH09_10120 [bacterium CPR1]|nr:hypothetical protein [bacterium CPR1]
MSRIGASAFGDQRGKSQFEITALRSEAVGPGKADDGACVGHGWGHLGAAQHAQTFLFFLELVHRQVQAQALSRLAQTALSDCPGVALEGLGLVTGGSELHPCP